jgi:tetratricopeptide (TPR) repeat protein
MNADSLRPETLLTLLQALFDAGWGRSVGDAGAWWFDLAQLRVERGELELARAALAQVTDPESLVEARSDRRFDAVIEGTTLARDIEQTAAARVASLAKLALESPQVEGIAMRQASAMLTVGMHSDVVALVDRVLAQADAAPSGAKPPVAADEIPWLLDRRSTALMRLGRGEEAVETLTRAARLNEHGSRNVSQALNLGAMYCSLGRAERALAAIAGVELMSGYGQMIKRSVELCATIQQRDPVRVEQLLALLREQRKDGPTVYLESLLRAGRNDDGAQVLIDLLADPEARGQALIWMQDGLRPEPGPGDTAYEANRTALLKRRDVLDALAPVGRIERHALYL